MWRLFIICMEFCIGALLRQINAECVEHTVHYAAVSLAIRFDDDDYLLPYVLGSIENLEYPKDVMNLDIYCNGDYQDFTSSKVSIWVNNVKPLYKSIQLNRGVDDWQELALTKARKTSKYLFMMRDSHLLLNMRTLQILMAKKAVVVSPLLHEPFDYISQIFSSSDESTSMETTIAVEPMLIKLFGGDSNYLTFSPDNLFSFSKDYSGDPLSAFGFSGSLAKIPFLVDNGTLFGTVIDQTLPLAARKNLFSYFVAELISDIGVGPIVTSSIINPNYPNPSLFGMDKIYLINLERRPVRRQKMEEIFKVIGINYTLWNGTDGLHLDSQGLSENIRMLPNYEDPYWKRPMKWGEVGCFLSHFRIWRDMVENRYERVIVFEDDVRFKLNSMQHLLELLKDLDSSKMYWDFIYLGRKQLDDLELSWVEGHRHLSTVGYSYWTLGYMLSLSGAQKLLSEYPLIKLLPIDEYIPIMFDQHPNKEWKLHFGNRDLVAFTVYPTFVVPERFTNEGGYISDTEASATLVPTLVKDEL